MRHLAPFVAAAVVLAWSGPLYAHGTHCVGAALEIHDSAGGEGDYVVEKGGAVSVRASVSNCGDRREPIRIDVVVLDGSGNQLADLAHTVSLAAGQSQELNAVVPIPEGIPDLYVCYELVARTLLEPFVSASSGQDCIQIVEPS